MNHILWTSLSLLKKTLWGLFLLVAGGGQCQTLVSGVESLVAESASYAGYLLLVPIQIANYRFTASVGLPSVQKAMVAREPQNYDASFLVNWISYF